MQYIVVRYLVSYDSYLKRNYAMHCSKLTDTNYRMAGSWPAQDRYPSTVHCAWKSKICNHWQRRPADGPVTGLMEKVWHNNVITVVVALRAARFSQCSSCSVSRLLYGETYIDGCIRILHNLLQSTCEREGSELARRRHHYRDSASLRHLLQQIETSHVSRDLLEVKYIKSENTKNAHWITVVSLRRPR